MYKSIYLARRNPALTSEQFHERWKAHSALTGTTQNIRPYFTQVVQCARCDLAGPPDASLEFDGANLLSLVDRAGGYGVFDEPEHRDIMLPDELLTFSGPIRDCQLVTREQVCKPGDFSRYLILRFLKFADRTDPEAVFGRWCDLQAGRDDEGAAGALVSRSVANLVVEPAPTGMPHDLVTETWFRDVPALERHSQDDGVRRALEDAVARLCDATSTITFVARVNHARPSIKD